MKKLLILLFTLISFNTFAVEKKTTFTQDLFNEAQKNGKIVVINSWNKSCGTCAQQTKVLNEASIRAKIDTLKGLKENVIVGHKIPAGTGLFENKNTIVGSQVEIDRLESLKNENLEITEEETIEVSETVAVIKED